MISSIKEEVYTMIQKKMKQIIFKKRNQESIKKQDFDINLKEVLGVKFF